MADIFGFFWTMIKALGYFFFGWMSTDFMGSHHFWSTVPFGPSVLILLMPALMTGYINVRRINLGDSEAFVWLYIHLYTLVVSWIFSLSLALLGLIKWKLEGGVGLSHERVDVLGLLKWGSIFIVAFFMVNGSLVSDKVFQVYRDFRGHSSFRGFPRCHLTYVRIGFIFVTLLISLHFSSRDYFSGRDEEKAVVIDSQGGD